MASTGGFILGLAFDGDRALFACDLKSASLFRFDLASGSLRRFAAAGIRIPNYPLVDRKRNRLLVSDSHDSAEPGPGIWAYDLESGAGALWYDRPLVFANGIALTGDGNAVLVCETFARRVTRIEIAGDGSAGTATVFADDLPGLPDGIALDDSGALFIGCYEPSRILRVPAGGGAGEIYIEDSTAHLFAHPTNIAFDGMNLYTANLGRWHVTKVVTDTFGTPLHRRVEEAAR